MIANPATPGEEARDVEIVSVSHGGHGLARIDGQVCFVAGALPGDIVDLRAIHRNKGVLWATIARIVTPSQDRTVADCPVFGLCGGCTWLHFAYPAQAEWKRRIVAESFRRLARMEVETGLIENPDLRRHYRTRARFHGDGKRWGFYAEESHNVTAIDACPLLHARLNDALNTLRSLPVQGSVEITVNPEGDDILVWVPEVSSALRSAFPHVNAPKDRTRASFLFDGVPIVNGAFSQGSLLLNRLLVSHVHAAAEGSQRVLDLYCGAGNFTLGLADGVHVTGIDHNRAATTAAAALGRGQYRTGDERDMVNAIAEGPWDTIILDPPRTGAKALVPALARSEAARIVYVSCDPATLARDVARLAAEGRRIDSLHAVDMFPHTWHVESLCVLSRA